MKMQSIIPAMALLVLAGCASTSYQSTWKNPKVTEPVEISGKKVVVVASGAPASTRRSIEDAISGELTKAGAVGTPSYQVFTGKSVTVEDAKATLSAGGYDAAYVVRMTNREQEISSTPGMYAPAGRYSYWGWGGGYGAAPEIRTDVKVYIETLVYSVKHDELAWSGMSVTTNPDNIAASAGELVRVAMDEMKKNGLLKPSVATQ